MICEADCQAKLEGLQTITTSSGLKYKDIETGKGPNPPVGFQVSSGGPFQDPIGNTTPAMDAPTIGVLMGYQRSISNRVALCLGHAKTQTRHLEACCCERAVGLVPTDAGSIPAASWKQHRV